MGAFGLTPKTTVFGGDMSEADAKKARGTPEAIFARIRAQHGLGPEVSDRQLIISTICSMSGPAAYSRAVRAYRKFKDDRDVPYETYRYGDPDAANWPLTLFS